jgi:chaperone required for assembly of F1-ATPase
MQKLKMVTTGPNRNYRKGQVVEVDDQRADILLDGKHAVRVGEEVRDGEVRTEDR